MHSHRSGESRTKSPGSSSAFQQSPTGGLTTTGSTLAITMYGYGLAAERFAAVEHLTPRSAISYLRSPHATHRTPCWNDRGSESARSTLTARSSVSSPSLGGRGGTPRVQSNQKLDVRMAQLMHAQRTMEVADRVQLQAAELVGGDKRCCCDGELHVREDSSLESALVAKIEPHTRLLVASKCDLDDGSVRALVMLEGQAQVLGWVTYRTPTGSALLYVYARPLYEVVKKPLKIRREFDQLSKFCGQLAVGTRTHVVEMRRAIDGTHRCRCQVLGEEEAVGWITWKKGNGDHFLIEVKDADNQRTSPLESSVPSSKYAHVAFEALDRAALQLISQQKFIRSAMIEATCAKAKQPAMELFEQHHTMINGKKPLAVQLGEIFHEKPFNLDAMMKEAETSGSSPAIAGKISKMEFRMYVRKLLDQQDMLSSHAGAAEIDKIFPQLDANGDGEIDISELESTMKKAEAARALHCSQASALHERYERHEQFIDRLRAALEPTLAAERAFADRSAAQKDPLGPRLGALLTEKHLTAGSVATAWMSDIASIDKAAFRRNCMSVGLPADPSEIDRVFVGVLNFVGSQGSLNQGQLEQGLARLQQLGEATSQLNIVVIETAQACKAAQEVHKKVMAEYAVWSTPPASKAKGRSGQTNMMKHITTMDKRGGGAEKVVHGKESDVVKQPVAKVKAVSVPGDKLGPKASHLAIDEAANSCMALKMETAKDLADEAAACEAPLSSVGESLDKTTLAVRLGETFVARKIKVDQLVREWDQDKDGSVSRQEFRINMRKLFAKAPPKGDEVDALFKELDNDGGGDLDVDELKVAFGKLKDAVVKAKENASKSQEAAEMLRMVAVRVRGVADQLAKKEAMALELIQMRKGDVRSKLGDAINARNLKATEVAQSWDVSGDGEIDKKEFRMNVLALNINAEADEIDALFDTLDTDGGGSLNTSEVKKALRKIQDASNSKKDQVRELGRNFIATCKACKVAINELRRDQKEQEEAVKAADTQREKATEEAKAAARAVKAANAQT